MFKRAYSLNINNLKIRNKLLIIYIACVLVPITATNFIFYRDVVGRIEQQKRQDIHISLQKIQQDIEKSIQEVIALSHKVYTDERQYTLLESQYSGILEYVEVYNNDFNLLLSNMPYYQQIDSFAIYTDNHSIYDSGRILKISDHVRNTQWFKRTVDLPGTVVFCQYLKDDVVNNSKIKYFSLLRKLDYYQHLNHYEKILKVDIKLSVFSDILNEEKMDGALYLVDEIGRIIAMNGNKEINDEIGEFQQIDHVKVGKHQFVVEKDLSLLKGWKTIGIFDKDQITGAFADARDQTILITTLNLVLCSTMIWLVSRSFYVRLGILAKHVRKVQNQQFELISEVNEGNDEIGLLIHGMNNMTTKIKELIENVYQAQIRQTQIELGKKQAELNALQSQVNPHFMFNVLEAVRLKSVMKNEVETARIIKYMSKVFRKLITWGNDWVTVAEEVEFIKEFLEIQKYRFGDELEFDVSVSDEASRYKIPKMVLQPFVENACIHGVEAVTDKRRIEVKILAEDSRLYCKVEDNGIGIGSERLSKILAGARDLEQSGGSVGIRNVFRRLQLYYGEDFAFNIESEKNIHTTVTLDIPLLKETIE